MDDAPEPDKAPEPEPSTALVRASANVELEVPAGKALAGLVNRAAKAGLGVFIPRILGAPLEQAVGILADAFGFVRAELLIPYLARTKRRLEEAGIDYGNLGPLDVSKLFPILESASIAAEESMQDRWASLLANALVEPDGVLTSFAAILRELDPMDARVLDHMFTTSVKGEARAEVTTPGPTLEAIEHGAGLGPGVYTQARLENLVRLELVSLPLHAKTYAGTSPVEHRGDVTLTAFGADFIRACRGPEAQKG